MKNFFWLLVILFISSACESIDNTNKISSPKSKEFGINLKTTNSGIEIKN